MAVSGLLNDEGIFCLFEYFFGMWKFLGQVPNLWHSSNPSCHINKADFEPAEPQGNSEDTFLKPEGPQGESRVKNVTGRTGMWISDLGCVKFQ